MRSIIYAPVSLALNAMVEDIKSLTLMDISSSAIPHALAVWCREYFPKVDTGESSEHGVQDGKREKARERRACEGLGGAVFGWSGFIACASRVELRDKEGVKTSASLPIG
jgi:hypothetical protein